MSCRKELETLCQNKSESPEWLMKMALWGGVDPRNSLDAFEDEVMIGLAFRRRVEWLEEDPEAYS